jgi:chemotaxis protein MotA
MERLNPTLAALSLALLAVFGAHLLDGGDLGTLLHGTALLIVLGGSFSAVLLQTPPAILRRGIALARCLREGQLRADHESMIQDMVQHSRLTRSNGFLALEPAALIEDDPFRRRALEMLVDGVESEELRRILATDIETWESRERQAARVWESMGAYAPTMGILGAVMGLIQVMQNLSQPAALGSGIAVAFVSTLYGVGLANLLFLPLANRIKARIAEEARLRRMLVEGYGAVAAGIHPRLVEQRLRGHLAT